LRPRLRALAALADSLRSAGRTRRADRTASSRLGHEFERASAEEVKRRLDETRERLAREIRPWDE
jgi:hypothetical protein